MSDVFLEIDGQRVAAEEGTTILKAAQSAGIEIPTLCHYEGLEPYGACRICTVEAQENGRTRLVAGCLFPVKDGLVVRTRSEKIDMLRKTILELLLAHAPEAPALVELGRIYGANPGRFEKEASFCILCGLCVRYCAEVKKMNAVGFVGRGSSREIMFIPEVATKVCWDCKECFPLCPTSYLQAAYGLVAALAGHQKTGSPLR